MKDTEDLALIEDDSFLSKEEVDNYFSLVSSSDFPWYIHVKTGVGYDSISETEKEDSVLIHYAYIDGKPNSEYYSSFKHIFDKFCEKYKIDYSAILRIRLNLFFSREDQKPTGAHIDTYKDHLVFLYYFNDSDGDTVFYENTYDGESMSPGEDLVEMHRSTPKSGKAVLFNGRRYHSPTTPKNNRLRFTLNVDFV
jgi:hypothetical protein